MRGIVSYGAYLPYWRLDRKAIAEALGVPAGSGTRAVASYDEDTTSLGVEAGRAALRGATVVPAGALLRDLRPGVSRQDQRDRHSRRARSADVGLRRGHRRLRALGGRRHARGARRAGSRARRAQRHPHRAAGRRRRARWRRRRRGVPLRRRRARRARAGRAARRRLGDRGVSRPLAAARRIRLARVGGALRRARLRAAGRGRAGRGAQERGRDGAGHHAPDRRRTRTAARSSAWRRRPA